VPRPLVVFDGDCGFCRFWIERWRRYTRDAVDYEPFQNPEIAARFPTIPRERFARAVQLIEPDGRVSEAAHAVFRLGAIARRHSAPLWAYEHLPGFAALTERAYQHVANHRRFWSGLTTLLWGRSTAPATYARTAWIFLRLLGVVYFLAFWSLGIQLQALIGHDGILPADRYMNDAGAVLTGLDRFRLLPTLGWLTASDAALQSLWLAGCGLSILLVVGLVPTAVLSALWVSYLSLSVVSRDFLSYQWDGLLLETGLLAIFLAPITLRERLQPLADPPRIIVRLMLWLLFRLTVSSGAVKLLSGDPTWTSLTALAFHFETQPIPTPLAWYAHQLPQWLLKAATFGVIAIELAVPFLILAPRRLRALAFVPLAGLQLFIALTGNYAFFNLLTVALCVFLLDDSTLGNWGRLPSVEARPGVARRWTLRAFAIVIVPVSLVVFARTLGIRPAVTAPIERLARWIAPLRSVNGYGLFAVMTTTRPEIVVEGSDDGTTWMEYEFRYKPGDLQRRPPWVAPHQPRLDWQMWFAALGRPGDEPWIGDFLMALLEGNQTILGLLERDPFQGRRPQFVRAVLYRYEFSTAEERRRDGVWWRRERLGAYSRVLSANDLTR
jgi:predicted DCC family thiol-disulfide oxidoreductase YuxK